MGQRGSVTHRSVPRAEGLRSILWLRSGLPAQQLMVLVAGTASVLLTVTVVNQARTGLERVTDGAQEVARLDSARGSFQDADMMHDALYADVLSAVLDGGADAPFLPGRPAAEVAQDAARFRADLRAVDAIDLPPALRLELTRLRPVQQAYIAEAERLAGPDQDPTQRRAELPAFRNAFLALKDEQDAITQSLLEQSQRARAVADRDQRGARQSLVAGGIGALLGLVALSVWLYRVVRVLALRVRQEHGVAETMQRMLLPEALPDVPGVRLAAQYVPSAEGNLVGGDWYDVLVLPCGQVGLVMGDVAGHDLGAAAEMSQLRNALRAYACEGARPVEVLERLNALCFQQQLATIATCVYAVLDPVARTLTVVNAGHYPPLLLEPLRTTYLDAAPQPPVGAVRAPEYTASTCVLPPECVVLLYTDGLMERRAVAVQEGLDRLALVAKDAPRDVEQLVAHVLDRMLDGGRPQDDVALMAVAPAAQLGEHVRMTCLADPASLLGLRRTVQRWLGESGAGEQECFEVTVACSEAATNAIEHAYGPGRGYYEVDLTRTGEDLTLRVRDWGSWRPPRGQDRGRGTMLMRSLMDEAHVVHGAQGTVVTLRRTLLPPAPAATGVRG